MGAGFIHFFKPKIQGLFKDFPGPYSEISRTILYRNLPTAKQNVRVESYVLDIKRALATKNERFHAECYTLYLKICFYWPLFNLKLASADIFWSCSIKNQGLSRTKNQFQGLSRSWNWTPEIQGFSRVFKTTNPVGGSSTWSGLKVICTLLKCEVHWVVFFSIHLN